VKVSLRPCWQKGSVWCQGLPLLVGRNSRLDTAASEACAVLRARTQALGKAISGTEGCIAATATAHDLIVATRGSGPIEATGLTVINPWRTWHCWPEQMPSAWAYHPKASYQIRL